MKFIVKLVIFVSLLFETAYCQENYQTRISTYIDSISYRLDKNDIKIGKEVNFKFPPLDKGDPYIFRCIEAQSYKEKNFNGEKEEFYGCAFEFDKGQLIEEKIDKRIKIKCYSQHVDTLHIAVKISPLKDMWITISHVYPRENRLYHTYDVRLDQISEKIINSIQSNSNLSADSLIITGLKIFTKKEDRQRLILGDLLFYSKNIVSALSQEDFYDKLVYRNIRLYHNNLKFKRSGKKQIEKKLSLFEDSGIEFLLYGIQTELFIPEEIENAADSVRENLRIKYVSSYVRNILVDYFQNTDNNNDFIIARYDSLVKNCNSLDSFYDDLENLLYQVEDTHFRLINEKNTRYSSLAPLYFYKILDKIQVVAVLDTTLLSQVTLGDILISVNDKPVEDYIAKLDGKTTGTSFHSRERKIVQKLLHNISLEVNDTLHLTLKSSIGGTYSIKLPQQKIFNNKCLSIPANIQEKRKRYDYKKIEDYAYIKVGHFVESQLRSFVYTYIDSIMDSKGIIIDFRNNSAGDFSLSFFLSFFIDKPTILFTDSKGDGNCETIMVPPDPFYYYEAPVVIIFDSRTTCASEFFINALQNVREDVVTISTTQTGGAGQRASYLSLPTTEKFRGRLLYRANILYDSYGANLDKGGGIKPMIWTYLKSYLDLAPYNDKLLNKALRYLKKYNSILNNKNDLR